MYRTPKPDERVIEHDLDEDGTFLKEEGGEVVLCQLNEGGHNGTTIKVRQLVAWLRANAPELLTDDREHREYTWLQSFYAHFQPNHVPRVGEALLGYRFRAHVVIGPTHDELVTVDWADRR